MVQSIYTTQLHFLNILAVTGGVLCLLLTIGWGLVGTYNRSLLDRELAESLFRLPLIAKGSKNQVRDIKKKE